MAQNNMHICAETLADGNCGIHAFWLGLQDIAASNHRLRQTNAYKQAAKADVSPAAICKHLRGKGTLWMEQHGDTLMWEGMQFKTLALMMSSEKETYSQHVARMKGDKVWVDASMIHALCCCMAVDAGVWQNNADPMLVGISLGGRQSLALVPMVMINDLHFWGVLKAEVAVIGQVENGDWVRRPRLPDTKRKGGTDDADDADDDAELAGLIPLSGVAFVEKKPNSMQDGEVDAELKLCKCLQAWDPWSEPGQGMLDAMDALTSPSTASRCMLRSQVVQQLMNEQASAETLPEKFKYHATARYRLQCNRPQLQQRTTTVARSVMEHLEVPSTADLQVAC